jgi:hypothetical protein
MKTIPYEKLKETIDRDPLIRAIADDRTEAIETGRDWMSFSLKQEEPPPPKKSARPPRDRTVLWVRKRIANKNSQTGTVELSMVFPGNDGETDEGWSVKLVSPRARLLVDMLIEEQHK